MESPHHNSPWQACPPGELVRLGRRVRRQQTGRRAVQALTIGSAVGAVLLVGASIGMQLANAPAGSQLAGLRCSDVFELADQFQQNDLTPETRQHIIEHLDRCPRCHDKYRDLGLISWAWETISVVWA